MLDLLINSLRMRPDRIVKGEVRKRTEAEVVFEAMHTGHSVYATLHADTVNQVIRRMTNPPINVPPVMLESLNLEGFPGLVRARDLFLLASWTGLRFSDLQILTIDHLHGDNIVIKTQKTEKEVVIPVFPIVRNVLIKYKDTGLPSITNQALNRSLKNLGAKLEEASNLKGITADVSKYNRITTHTARRSFATNLYHIVPIELIMSVTGHKTQTEFYKYIRVTPKENADKLRQYFPLLMNEEKLGSV